MKRTCIAALLLMAALLTGCARTAGPDILDPEGVGGVHAAPAADDELVPATATPEPTETPAPTATPAPTEKPAKATATPAPAAKTDAATAPAASSMTKADLVSALNGALGFYGSWCYDTASLIDPDVTEPAATVAHLTGEMDVFPVSSRNFATYDELFAAVCRHFHEEIADVLLDESGAQDVDGKLCIGKVAPADTAEYLCELDIEREGNMFDFDLEYAPADAPRADQDVTVRYELRDGTWAFAGRPSAINRFFTVLMTAQDLVVKYDPD